MLKQIKIKTKTLVIVVLGIICISAVTVYALYEIKTVIIGERQAAVRQIVEEAISVAKNYHDRVVNGVLDDAAAQAQAKAEIRTLKYGENGYIFVDDISGTTLVNRANPSSEGTNGVNAVDIAGHKFIQDQLNAAKSGGGYVFYFAKKPGRGEEQLQENGLYGPFPRMELDVGVRVSISTISTMRSSLSRLRLAQACWRRFVSWL